MPKSSEGKATAHHGDTENYGAARTGPPASAPVTTVASAASWSFERIPHAREVALPLEYKGVQIRKAYFIDLLIEDALVAEVKSVEKLMPIHTSQLLTYMQIKRASAGLLINFNVQTLFLRSSPWRSLPRV
jgi:GxxExxY protein